MHGLCFSLNALNTVICSPADPCLFVKWANLPQPFREATTKNSKQPQSARNCDWLGLGMLCSRRFPAPSQNLTSSIIPLLILICNFFFFHPHANSKWQTQRSKGEQRDSICNFPSTSPPRLQTDANVFLKVLFLYRSPSLAWLFLKLKSDILFVMPSMQSGCHRPPMSTFWILFLAVPTPSWGATEPLSFSVS